MSNIDTVAPPPPKKRRRESWPRYAERHSVCTRTLDRWVENGILPPPEYIRGRKYIDPDVEPRADVA